MYKILLLLPILISCTTLTVAPDTSKNYTSPPKQLYSGSFHKSYQYHILTNSCTKAEDDAQPEVNEFCDMALELHYFVDSPITHLMSNIMQEHNRLFRFVVATEFKIEINDNELSISNAQGGEWYKFEEKLENDKNLLWIRVSYEEEDKPLVADIVLDMTDPSNPQKIYAVDENTDTEEVQWADIKKELKRSKK
jgi:hypothetical protein